MHRHVSISGMFQLCTGREGAGGMGRRGRSSSFPQMLDQTLCPISSLDPEIPFTSAVSPDSVCLPANSSHTQPSEAFPWTLGPFSYGNFCVPMPSLLQGSQWLMYKYKSPAPSPQVGQTLSCYLYSRATHILAKLLCTLADLPTSHLYWFFLGTLL